jgi:predicted nucleotidyltransferase
MDQIAVLLARYDIEDPIQDDRCGKFNSPAMQELYNDLVTRGSASEAEALKVGATIEDLDIHDLETALQGGVDNQDIALVYRNLAKGSRNHIRAFNTQLSARGQTYSAQHITQADLDAILAGGHERGPADGQQMAGRGQGKGRSKGRGRP